MTITYKELNQRIDEAKQRGNLYHYSSSDNALEILKDNKLNSSNRPNKTGNKHYHAISLTRDKNFHKTDDDKVKSNDWKHTRAGVQTHISFELDGDKLSNKHRISPKHDVYGLKTEHPKQQDESEEEIRRSDGDRFHVKDIKKYIKKIRVHGPLHPSDEKELNSHGIKVEKHY